ncbi:hypothetical protein D3C85_1111580 [compost metagenome]
MEFIELINGFQVDKHIKRNGFSTPFGMPHIAFIKIKQIGNTRSALVFGSSFGRNTLNGKFERI